MNGTDPNFHGHWRPLRAISIALCPSCVDYEEQFSSKDLMDYTMCATRYACPAPLKLTAANFAASTRRFLSSLVASISA